MESLEKPITRVWRRMRMQRFLSALVWCLASALAAATVVLIVEKSGYPVPGAAWWPFAIAAALGVIAAGLVAILSGPGRIDAAVALDRAFQLNERLSTALTLPESLRETAVGKALIADAAAKVGTIDVASRFGLTVPRKSWVPLIPVALAGAILLAPPWTRTRADARAATTASTKVESKAVAKSGEALGKKMAEQRKQIDKQKFAEAERLLAEVEKIADGLAKSPPAQKDKAMMALNQLTDAIKERQKQLGSPEQVNRQLQQLKEMASDGPAEDFAKALAKGDFAKSAEELKQIKQKLASGKMTEKEKEALKNQIGEMGKQLEKLANLDQRKKQLEEARKNGGLSQEQFDKEMAKLNDQAKGLEGLKKMADKLSQAQQEMANGDTKKAAETLGMSEKQLEKMAQELQEMQSLEGALADLQDAKNGMNGEGMNQLGEGMSQSGLGGRSPNQMGDGQGRGRGRGEGDRAEAPDDVNAYNTRAKQQFGKGAAVVEGTAPPISQTKGQSGIAIQGEVETATGAAADALTNQKIPKTVEKHIRGYFDQINKGN
ncbi:hypothetical protein TA3x_003287 [Tundrisphaera sp. TA3]|uniref:hypothetical protein n=1 Tax=Tundrisphaera sp. TA3 TaxID=3435775 RepID=UPI003EB91E2D